MAKIVYIAFKDRFRQPMLGGIKVCTSRNKPHAAIGDYFIAFDTYFEIIGLYQLPLGQVAKYLWKEEGCKSEQDFISIWKSIHPYKGFDPNWLVYVHVFNKIG